VNVPSKDRNIGPHPLAGWCAIASGILGILAYVSLITFLQMRSINEEASGWMLRLHDGGVVLQFLLLIPVPISLWQLTQSRPPRLGTAMVAAGVVALMSVVLLLILTFLGIVWNVLYMFPQGLFGLWLMIAMGRTRGLLPLWMKGFGVVVGLGLVLVGLFPIGYGLFVERAVFRIPVGDLGSSLPEFTPLNALLHRILAIGSYLGVATLPIWSALLGWRLLRARSVQIDLL
jgi:hypothetical protein